jgi:hypothetical protein
MIGPAEIEDMLSEYEEAMNKEGVELLPTQVTWPVTQRPVPRTFLPTANAGSRSAGLQCAQLLVHFAPEESRASRGTGEPPALVMRQTWF